VRYATGRNPPYRELRKNPARTWALGGSPLSCVLVAAPSLVCKISPWYARCQLEAKSRCEHSLVALRKCPASAEIGEFSR
jgi:hypothetical protein